MSDLRESLPEWAKEMIALYESDSANQFILFGNIYDRFLFGADDRTTHGCLTDFLKQVLMPQFDVIFIYDLGNGLRVERGGEKLKEWPPIQAAPELPKVPRPAAELLTRYLRYCANLGRMNRGRVSVGVIVESSHLVSPAVPGVLNYDLNALALLFREWASEELLHGHPVATCLLTENLNDLHPIVVQNPRVAKIKIPLPTVEDLSGAIDLVGASYPKALAGYRDDTHRLAKGLTGITINGLDRLLRLKEYKKESLSDADLAEQKRLLVEEECQGLIEFIEPKRTLDDLYGLETLKECFRQDLTLWRSSDLRGLPMGYLICGPVGTGKTFLVECLAGEAGVPVVKIKNFRDRWVGSTEGNLEKIFRLLQALDRCYVFVDEADQALGRRDSSGQDAGLSGRIYSMMAAEMSRPENRGRVIWVLASSRPDLIEVDLKRPGRVDLKVPIFPTGSPEEGYQLLRSLAKRYTLDLAPTYEKAIPDLLTPGAAETIIVKAYRVMQTAHISAMDALDRCLAQYQSPVAPDILEAQIKLAIREASDMEFVPSKIRERFGE
ncbi:MAG TPA: AAA family ATPase [Chthoniobacterales bacterium]|nr:AAA family ATPase [Chthoniobacterales bacterium]